MTRSYQEQLDHLNNVVGNMRRHANKALNRRRVPIVFDEWFGEMQELLASADDEEVYTRQIEEENKLPDNPNEGQKLDCYIKVLELSANMLADKKQSLRIDEYEASSEYYLCAGEREYEISGNEFRVDGEVRSLEPKELEVMRLVLSSSHRDIKATEMACKIWNDSGYVIEAPHLISDINAKIKNGRDMPNPLSRIGGELLPQGKRASIWHLYLRGEPRPEE